MLQPQRQTLLFLSPVIPAVSGNGLAMRAGATLTALAERFDVTLVVAPLYASPAPAIPETFARLCQRVILAAEPSEALAALGDARFDVLHVFRLAMAPAAAAFVARAGQLHLDLDDLESESGRRLAALHSLHGEHASAVRALADAERAGESEAAILREWDRVYVCSERDRQALADRYPSGRQQPRAEIVILPNTLPMQGPFPLPPSDEPFGLLFVGTLGYLPNADGINWFCREVVPLLRTAAARPFRLEIVGIGAGSEVLALHAPPEIIVVGAVDDLRPHYQAASAVIAPLRGGGGTRIKILEAFSYRRPVISTTIGMEGIEARHETHALLADEPAALATACARLMSDPGLCARLTHEAHGLFHRSYRTDALRERVRSW